MSKFDELIFYPLFGELERNAADELFFGRLNLSLANDKNLNVCDFLAFPGFPEWHDHMSNRPILRTGTISSDPRFPYSYERNGFYVKGECMAYEAFSHNGSSGSPVFALEKGPKPGAGISFPGFRKSMCIGINAGHLPTTEQEQHSTDQFKRSFHSGISYFYKSTAIIDVINKIDIDYEFKSAFHDRAIST